MVTGFEEDTTWGYDAELGYDEEQRRAEGERRTAASGVWPVGFGEPPPGAPSPATTSARRTGAAQAGLPVSLGASFTATPVEPALPLWSDSDGGSGGLADATSASGVWRDSLAAATDKSDPSPEPPAQQPRAHPARMVLGLATMAAERLRGGAPPSDALATGVGLVQESAAGARDFARRVLKPATRFASDAVDRASQLPGADRPLRTLRRSRSQFNQVVARARRRGEATVSAGRAEAEAFVRSSVAETLSWAQAQAVPQIVDGLVPHLVDQVVPRILEGTLPEIRSRVLPAMIDDMANSPQVRDLVLEQGRGVVGEAAVNLRSTTASADDRIESAVRRLVRAPSPDEPADARADEPRHNEPRHNDARHNDSPHDPRHNDPRR